MKKNDKKQLLNATGADLKKSVGEWRNTLWQLRADLSQGKVKNVREITTIKKKIARALTVLQTKSTSGGK